MSIEEVLGSLCVHESRLVERDSCEEEKALLTKATNLSKKGDWGQSSKWRGIFGQRGRGRERGRGRQLKEECGEEDKKPFDKSKIKCYNCQKMGHFSDACHFDKNKKVKEEIANVAEESEEESALMMLSDGDFSEQLLQGNGGEVNNDSWYLNTGASSHMIGIKAFFHSIDEEKKSVVRFGDGSFIKYEGRGVIIVLCKNGEEMELEGVLYLQDLKTNILSLRKLNDQGCRTSFSEGYLTTRDKKGKLLTKTKKTRGNMYQMRLIISEKCRM